METQFWNPLIKSPMWGTMCADSHSYSRSLMLSKMPWCGRAAYAGLWKIGECAQEGVLCGEKTPDHLAHAHVAA